MGVAAGARVEDRGWCSLSFDGEAGIGEKIGFCG